MSEPKYYCPPRERDERDVPPKTICPEDVPDFQERYREDKRDE